MMQTIAALREKYDLHMTVERYVNAGTPDPDNEFIRKQRKCESRKTARSPAMLADHQAVFLCLDFPSVPERHPDVILGVQGEMVYHPVECVAGEFRQGIGVLSNAMRKSPAPAFRSCVSCILPLCSLISFLSWSYRVARLS